jgi:hypothetical protein
MLLTVLAALELASGAVTGWLAVALGVSLVIGWGNIIGRRWRQHVFLQIILAPLFILTMLTENLSPRKWDRDTRLGVLCLGFGPGVYFLAEQWLWERVPVPIVAAILAAPIVLGTASIVSRQRALQRRPLRDVLYLLSSPAETAPHSLIFHIEHYQRHFAPGEESPTRAVVDVDPAEQDRTGTELSVPRLRHGA